jgi:hypothetical protein
MRAYPNRSRTQVIMHCSQPSVRHLDAAAEVEEGEPEAARSPSSICQTPHDSIGVKLGELITRITCIKEVASISWASCTRSTESLQVQVHAVTSFSNLRNTNSVDPRLTPAPYHPPCTCVCMHAPQHTACGWRGSPELIDSLCLSTRGTSTSHRYLYL